MPSRFPVWCHRQFALAGLPKSGSATRGSRSATTESASKIQILITKYNWISWPSQPPGALAAQQLAYGTNNFRFRPILNDAGFIQVGNILSSHLVVQLTLNCG